MFTPRSSQGQHLCGEVTGTRGVRQRVPKWKRPYYMTHIGVICVDSSLQAVLPHIIVADEHTLPARRLHTLARAAPPNVTRICQKSAWSNVVLMRRVVRVLADTFNRHEGSPERRSSSSLMLPRSIFTSRGCALAGRLGRGHCTTEDDQRVATLGRSCVCVVQGYTGCALP